MFQLRYLPAIYLGLINLENNKQKIALVTGSAGFIGYHVSKRLLEEGEEVGRLGRVEELEERVGRLLHLRHGALCGGEVVAVVVRWW